MASHRPAVLLDVIIVIVVAARLPLATSQRLDFDKHLVGRWQRRELRLRSRGTLQLIQQPGMRIVGYAREVSRPGTEAEAIGGNDGVFDRHAEPLGDGNQAMPDTTRVVRCR
ncbi:MAG: hypothetical protein HKO73_00200 [Woeseiaceae bacterium]|nr:hypothetical protein [Woeseiaceae bacterium]